MALINLISKQVYVDFYGVGARFKIYIPDLLGDCLFETVLPLADAKSSMSLNSLGVKAIDFPARSTNMSVAFISCLLFHI
jgi:hypothetical protein